MNIDVPALKSGSGTFPIPGFIGRSAVSHEYVSEALRVCPATRGCIAPSSVFTETASQWIPWSAGFPFDDDQSTSFAPSVYDGLPPPK